KKYIDNQTGEYLADHVGRCDREDNCGYHYTPRQYFAENPGDVRDRPIKWNGPVKPVCNYLPASLVTDSMKQKDYIDNNFIQFLAGMFSWEIALQATERYKIGTSKQWPGATVFWQVDAKNCVRTGKIMLFNKETGKRVKQPFNHVAWAHRLIGSKQLAVGSESNANRPPQTANFLLQQCFFGEHLLCENTTAPIAIAESEKTAVMASIMMPQFTWLAAGSLHGLDAHKCKALAHRSVLLFPDVGAYHHWTDCARTLNLRIPTATFTVHAEMERTATTEERAAGADMADRWVAEKNLLKLKN
ncbi:MAG: DUF6371 domain-containing protein, partial [Sphingobacteriales bacterium]